MIDFRSRLVSLDFEPLPGRHEAPKKLASQFEKRFGLTLPAVYRDFLVCCGACQGYATFPIEEPCPCGPSGVLEKFFGFMASAKAYDDIRSETDLTGGAPGVIPIAAGAFGSLVFLKCKGSDAGAVYFYDADQRSLWTDERFLKSFSNLSPDIREYLRKRRLGELPAKPEGYESFYRVAGSFQQFLESCEKSD